MQFDNIIANLEGHVEHLREEGVTHIDIPERIKRGGEEKSVMDLPEISRTPEKAVPGGNDKSLRDLSEIAAEVAVCKKCGLHRTRTKTVPGRGCLNPDIMFIGEAPGADEDATGLPFVGAAGKLLTRLITRLGYTRDELFIGNILKCRPPGNRNPQPDEMEICMPYLQRQIAAIRPSFIVTLGAVSAKALTGQHETSIGRLRGKWFSFENIDLMPTYHPAYLLRGQRKAYFQVWDDMLKVMARLGKEPPEKDGKK